MLARNPAPPLAPRSFIVALGGYNVVTGYLKTVEIFSSVNESWTGLPPLTTKRDVYPALCAINKTKLIACGGYNGTTSLSTCEALDLTNQGAGWSWVPSMSDARQVTSGMLLLDNKTFLVTGGNNGSFVLSSCEKLDITTNTWSSAGNLLGPRYGHSSVLYTTVILAMGGWNGNNSFNTCEQYDSVSNTWSSFPPFLIARDKFGAAVVLDKIYIAGGSNGAQLSSVEVYNGTKWSLLSSTLARVRYGCTAVAFQNKFVVLGGRERITTIEVFDPVTSTWNTTFPPMKISPTRDYMAAVSF